MKKYLPFLIAILSISITGFTQTVTLTSETIAASNVTQGSLNNIVYIARVDVSVSTATLTTLQFTLTGTHDNNDLTNYRIYFNSVPSLSGASFIGIGPATFAAPHTYSYDIPDQAISAGGTGYYIITDYIDAAATGGNTIKLNGAANPVVFTYTAAPTVINNQSDAAGAQTIIASGVTISTEAIAATNVAQGSSNNIVYIAKVDVTVTPVTVASVQFTLTGTHDNNDLTTYRIYFNTTPTLSGAVFIANSSATFAAPHTYFDDFPDQTIAAGASGYFIITDFVDAAATGGNTIKLNGAINPVTFTYTTAPFVTNNQTDAAGMQTIQTAGVTLSSETVAPSGMARGSSNNIVYILKMAVTALPVTVATMQFVLSGTHDNNDLTNYRIWVNSTPSLTGATFISNLPATFAAPHTYNDDIPNQAIAAGGTLYFLITINVDPTGTTGNTVKLNGATNPVTFTYTTSPPETNNQTDAAGVGTITDVLPLTLTSFTAIPINTLQAKLQWETSNELNTKHFELEWSSTGVEYFKIATMGAAGNSTENRHYNYLHRLPAKGNNYYRLKMYCKDGQFTYSGVVKLNISVAQAGVAIFPNPVKNNMYINGLANYQHLQIADAMGRIIHRQNISQGMQSINVGTLSEGIYMLTITGDTGIKTMMFIKND